MSGLSSIRVGLGYDSHRFAHGRSLVLGGVTIPGSLGLAGHSDADVLIHAIIDALLGATALGDIGSHFPDTDPRWKDADSSCLLQAVVQEVEAAGYALGNLDATVICQKPKLRPYVDAIRARLGSLLKVPAEQISVKGKTNEGMDASGRGEGIVAQCVVLLAARGTA